MKKLSLLAVIPLLLITTACDFRPHDHKSQLIAVYETCVEYAVSYETIRKRNNEYNYQVAIVDPVKVKACEDAFASTLNAIEPGTK